MTTRQHAVRLLMIAALAICAGAWWWASHSQAPLSAAPSESAGRSGSAPDIQDDAPAVPGARPAAAPLPPPDAALDSIALTLQQRADAGDSLAACRLGIELLRCQRIAHYDSVRPLVAERVARAEQEGELAAAEAMRQRDLGYVRLALACADLPSGLPDRGGAYLRQAARAGEPEAMLRYADGQAFDPRGGYEYLASPDFDAWRREAPAMLERALAVGRPEAVHLLHAAYASDEGMLQALVPNDPAAARTYSMLVTRLQGAGGRRLGGRYDVSKPTPEEFRRAAELSGEWHQRHFAGRRIDGARSLDAIAPLHDPLGVFGATGPDASFCTSAGESRHD